MIHPHQIPWVYKLTNFHHLMSRLIFNYTHAPSSCFSGVSLWRKKELINWLMFKRAFKKWRGMIKWGWGNRRWSWEWRKTAYCFLMEVLWELCLTLAIKMQSKRIKVENQIWDFVWSLFRTFMNEIKWDHYLHVMPNKKNLMKWI